MSTEALKPEENTQDGNVCNDDEEMAMGHKGYPWVTKINPTKYSNPKIDLYDGIWSLYPILCIHRHMFVENGAYDKIVYI